MTWSYIAGEGTRPTRSALSTGTVPAMQVHLNVPESVARACRAGGHTESGSGAPSILAAPSGLGDWASTLDALSTLFAAAKAAAVRGSPVVFLVSADALLGRTDPLDAMAATGVVSAGRTLALELAKQQAAVNCIAFTDSSPADEIVTWSLRLLNSGPDGPTGELIHLGGAQIGKALS